LPVVNRLSSDPESPFGSADAGFDAHARVYEQQWERDSVARYMRSAVRRLIESHLVSGAHVLDVGCGPGFDAVWLRETGHRVLAMDASPGMVQEARRRVPGLDARVLRAEDVIAVAGEGPFDLALLNFGVGNCVDLPVVSAGLARCVRPGGVVVLVLMPRVHPTWMLRELVRLRPGGALRRLRRRTSLPVSGAPVSFRYFGGATVERTFDAEFRVIDRLSLGLLLPPPGGHATASLVRALGRVESPLRRLPLLRSLGDHVVVVLERRPIDGAGRGSASGAGYRQS
jgi:SAM-dependent methyltransferase